MRRLILVTVAAGMLVLVPAGAPRDTAAKPTGRIVFSHRFWPRDPRLLDNWELFVRTLGGGPSVRVTRSPRCDDVFPSWSPEGRWIAFACNWNRSVGIYVIGADGRGRWPAVEFPNRRIEGTAWSPDGRKIAFGAAGIWVLNATGGGLRRLTRGDDSSPTWSRDSRSIAYEHAGDVFLMRADGTGRRRLVRRAEKPAWSPDGRRIVFLRRPDIWIMNADGTGQRRLRCCRPWGAGDVEWSPDSGYLAYEAGSGLDAGIHVMPVEGTPGPFVAGGDQLIGFAWTR
jgi:Tol biopolymer transport system component